MRAVPKGSLLYGGPGRGWLLSLVDPGAQAQSQSSALTGPTKLYSPAPYYTDEARELGVQGVVILQVVIDEHGQVTDAKMLRGLHEDLDQVAEATIRTWLFEPATLDDQPVSVYYNLTINFRLDHSERRDEGEKAG